MPPMRRAGASPPPASSRAIGNAAPIPMAAGAISSAARAAWVEQEPTAGRGGKVGHDAARQPGPGSRCCPCHRHRGAAERHAQGARVLTRPRADQRAARRANRQAADEHGHRRGERVGGRTDDECEHARPRNLGRERHDARDGQNDRRQPWLRYDRHRRNLPPRVFAPRRRP